MAGFRPGQVSSNLRVILNKIRHRNHKAAVHHCHPQSECSHCHKWHSTNSNQTRRNPLGIQMLSENLHKQVFHGNHKERLNEKDVMNLINKSLKHLQTHGLGNKESTPLQDVNLKLPKLHGKNIDEHFRSLANKYGAKYLELAKELSDVERLSSMPSSWVYKKGWTKYVEGQEPVAVSYPEDEAIVFDVEVCVTDGPYATMATAVSTKAWYSWCSARLIEDHFSVSDQPHITMSDLIPLESNATGRTRSSDEWVERVVVGHNVSFDRSFVKEQYLLQGTKTRFVDTMSLHMATSGLTTLQRKLWNASEKGKGTGDKRVKEFNARKGYQNRNRYQNGGGDHQLDWVKQSSLNNLGDVYSLYSNGEVLDKEERDVFVTGTMDDVRDRFQTLMTYCANDVIATHVVFKNVLPMFFERFPHPVTFAATLEMGQAYLPVNHNWSRYINEAEATYNNLRREMKLYLMRIAKEACSLMDERRYQTDLWLWDLDWSVQDFKLKKEKPVTIKERARLQAEEEKRQAAGEEETSEEIIHKVLATSERLPKRPQHMQGYPKWYRDLCPRIDCEDWAPGPYKISSQVRATPKLLRLTWDGYPLHYDEKQAWGYLVPKSGYQFKRKQESMEVNEQDGNETVGCDMEEVERGRTEQGGDEYEDEEDVLNKKNVEDKMAMFPISQLRSFIARKNIMAREAETDGESDKENIQTSTNGIQPPHKSDKVYEAAGIPECNFYRLPHKDGPNNKVGGPLAQDFLNKMEDGTLSSDGGEEAHRILEINNFISSWRNSKKRIM